MSIHIRLATLDERQALEQLQTRASLANEGDREAILAHPDAIELPAKQILAGRVFVAERDGIVAGFAAVLPRDDGQEELDGLFVEPHIWKSGVGRVLVERCAEFARERGATGLHVIGNPHALRFYTACGFETIGEYQTRFGPGILMRKPI